MILFFSFETFGLVKKTREHSGFVVSELVVGSDEQDPNIMIVHEKNTRHFSTVFIPTELKEFKNIQEMKIIYEAGTG